MHRFLQLTRDDEHLGNKPPPRSARFANLEDPKAGPTSNASAASSGVEKLIRKE
ncbi:MAG: hypothetical protein WKF75_15080 [Singulisphaera sp.]